MSTPASPFLQNAWYQIGWADELADGPLSRTVIDVPVAVFRTESGQLAAVEDMCPHRFAPLSRGKVVGEALQCGYHGLTFDGQGRCVANPLGGHIPSAARVRGIPAFEQDRALWVWMGEPERADPARIPRYPGLSDPTLRFVFGYTRAQAHYELITDNLMDLSHAAFLHPAFGGMDYIPEFKTEQDGETVWSRYLAPDMPNSEFFQALGGTWDGQIDAWDDMRWDAPATMYLESGGVPVGRPRSEALVIPAIHTLAPESVDATHYFWASGVDRDHPISDADYLAMLGQAFDVEDKPMIEAAHARMKGRDFWSLKPVLLGYDAGAVRTRRVLKEMIEREQAAR